MPRGNEVQIVDYSDTYGDAFERLNCEWLEKYFRVEPIDRIVLADPQGTIIDAGGVILYSIVEEIAVGTVALKFHGNGEYELTKMAVTDGYRGMGLGRQLMRAAVDRFRLLDGKRLYLESHSSLVVALTLYESAGFQHEVRPSPSEYERADVYMVYRPES